MNNYTNRFVLHVGENQGGLSAAVILLIFSLIYVDSVSLSVWLGWNRMFAAFIVMEWYMDFLWLCNAFRYFEGTNLCSLEFQIQVFLLWTISIWICSLQAIISIKIFFFDDYMRLFEIPSFCSKRLVVTSISDMYSLYFIFTNPTKYLYKYNEIAHTFSAEITKGWR